MKTRRHLRGHAFATHLVQFVVLIAIVIGILYACGNQSEDKSATVPKNNSTHTSLISQQTYPTQNYPSQNLAVQRTQNQAPSPQPMNNRAFQQADPRVIRRSDPRMTQPQTNFPPENNIPSQTSESQPSSLEQQSQPPQQFNPNEPIAPTPTTDLRLMARQQEDPEKMGKIIVIVAVIALAIIIFWFVHSNMMYKRTLRVVATSHPRPEESPTQQPTPPAPPQESSNQQPSDTHTAHDSHSVPTPQSPAGNDLVERLYKLKGLLDQGLISQEDYDIKKKDILSKI